MRKASVLFLAAITTFSGSAFAAGRGGHGTPVRAHAVRESVHRAAERDRREIHTTGPGFIYVDGDGPDYDSSDGAINYGGSSDDVCAPSVSNCPAPEEPTLAQRNAARDAMDQVQASLTADMQASPQWNEMSAATTQALSDLESARQRIETSLESRTDYQAALADKQTAEALVEQMRANGEDSPEELTPVAQRDLSASEVITRLQTQALSADPQWNAAQAELRATDAGRVAMQNQLHADLLNDPAWLAAREQLG